MGKRSISLVVPQDKPQQRDNFNPSRRRQLQPVISCEAKKSSKLNRRLNLILFKACSQWEKARGAGTGLTAPYAWPYSNE